MTPTFPHLNFASDDPSIPIKMVELMRVSQMRYQEGSDLIKSGESERARAAFNNAVDMVLRSEWDLSQTPVLHRFFQDLIQRIQQDESRYLQPPEVPDEWAESAVVDELENLDLIPIKVDPDLRDVVEADLANTKYDIPVHLNERVLKSLNYWLNKGRKYFADGLMRSGRYREMIERIFREESIPLDVMYLAQVESLFKTNALSRRAAKGIWQFGKWTAIRYGLKIDSRIDERSDPEKSTRAAARYLNDLYAMFKDWNLVLAAYNWGEGRVQRLIDKSGLNDFWGMMELRRNFPQETQNHVPLIMASIILGRNPEKYGLPTVLEQPLSHSEFELSKPIDLRAAATVLGVSTDLLKELNPAIRGYLTPVTSNFQLKVPVNATREHLLKLASLPAAKAEPLASRRHRIRPGETLSKIAARYRVSPHALRDANNLHSAKALRAGTWITIPGSARWSRSSSPENVGSTSRKSAAGSSTKTKSRTQPVTTAAGARSKDYSARVKKPPLKKPRTPIKIQQAAVK